jgi:succinate-semialdehyde dehydrogenase/glutarate-semialdehyde dehydrogenase
MFAAEQTGNWPDRRKEIDSVRSESDILASIPTKLFIGGEWVDAEGGATLTVSDPATGEQLAVIASASESDGQKAMDAAANAQESWGNSAPRVRGEILRKAWELLMERKEEFALLMTMEMGKPYSEALGEVNYGGEFLRWFSEEAVRINGRYGPNPEGTGTMVVTKRPVGPCFLITPWNFPLAMATRKIAPAIAAGCTSIIKPAELTPLTTLMFVKLLEEAGVPKGVVNVITTSSSRTVSPVIIADSRLRKISFTGSTQVGKVLLKQAADNVLRTSMELGGNAPFIVFEDADIDKAVEGVMVAKFRNIGQACTAANRVFVHKKVAAEFSKKVTERVAAMKIGRGTEDGVTIGPLIDEKAVASTASFVEDAVKLGGTVLTGGARVEGKGNFYQPTVISNVHPDTRFMCEEIFGPILGVIEFEDEAEVIRMANDTEYGLISYVYTNDLHRGQRLIEKLETGMMGLNTGLASNAAAPFGGMKQSGVGREGSHEGIEEYLTMKYTLIPNA